MHGGQEETKAIPARWRRDMRVGPDTGRAALLSFPVFSAASTQPVSDAIIFVGPPSPAALRLMTDDNGGATVLVSRGTYPLTVYRVSFKKYFDTVTVRAGFADTLLIGLGTDKICFT